MTGFARLAGMALPAVACLPAVSLAAENHPSKPIRLIVPFPNRWRAGSRRGGCSLGGDGARPPGLWHRALRWFVKAMIAAASIIALPVVAAESYPSKPIRLIVPFPPGGGNDFIARFTAQRMVNVLGQQVVIDNRPGAGGMIGIESAVNAVPDGYTLLLISPSYTCNSALYPLKFDPVNDITSIIQISHGPLLIVTNPALPAKTVKELIALAKAKPGQINYASSGQGSIIHLATELFDAMAGIKMTHVPYKGGGPALNDTIGGQTNVFFATIPPAKPQIAAGRLRGLAVTTPKRTPSMPDVPTVAEAGVPGYDVTLWHGIVGPKRLPRAIVDRINSAVVGVVKQQDTVEKLAVEGFVPEGSTPEQFHALIKKEVGVWSKVVKDAGIKQQ